MPSSRPRRLRLHQAPRPPIDYATATLVDLIGSNPSITIVEHFVDYPQEQVFQAVAIVERLVVPYPALFVAPWFWRIPAGRQLMHAQWSVYQHEAVRVIKIARMLYGNILRRDLDLVDRLFRHATLPYYHMPHNLTVYARRSQVLDVLAKNKHVLKRGQWSKARFLTDEQRQAIEKEGTTVPLEDFDDVGRKPYFSPTPVLWHKSEKNDDEPKARRRKAQAPVPESTEE